MRFRLSHSHPLPLPLPLLFPRYVGQPWIYGNSFFPMLVAVVTPDYAELMAAAKTGGWAAPTNEYVPSGFQPAGAVAEPPPCQS